MNIELEEGGEFVVVKDRRDGKLYIDKADSMLRNFEAVVAQGDHGELRLSWPEAKDLTHPGDAESC